MSLTNIVKRGQFIIYSKKGHITNVTKGKDIYISYKEEHKHSIRIFNDGTAEFHIFKPMEFFKEHSNGEQLKAIVRQYKLNNILT
jgi:hypothetical protein